MELLKTLYGIHAKSGSEKNMRDFVQKCCENLGAETVVDEAGNLYATKGISDTYPCVVSHLDQVQTNHSFDFRAYVTGDVIFGFSESSRSQEGLGADDKNGIWICLRCLERFDAIKVAFFPGEEVGCVGSSRADMDFFADCRFVLQCDRKGSSDLITSVCSTELCSDKFLEDIGMEEYGYEECSGLLTDVFTLKEKGLGVSCCNISCGYYKAHTDSEITVVSELKNCFDFVCHIITDCVDVYPHEYVAPKYSYKNDCYYGGYGKYNDDWYDDGYRSWNGDSYRGWNYQKKEDDAVQKSVFSIKEEEEYVEDDITNEVWELLYERPEMHFKEYWKNYGAYHGLKKKATRKIFDDVVAHFKEFNKDCTLVS